MSDYVTRKELASMMKVTERTIDLWREKGMPFIKTASGSVRFEKEKVVEWWRTGGK